MLTLRDLWPNRDCQGFSRRDFLRVGALGLGGWSLEQQLRVAGSPGAAVRAADSGVFRNRAVVMLFLQGGPSHLEFFDPKMTAPAEIRSVTGEVATRHPGISFGGTFPRLAALADRLTIVRSYGSGNSGHSYGEVVSANNPMKASASSVYARVRGTNHPTTGLPSNILVLPEAVSDGLKLDNNFETGALPTLTQPGSLGTTYAAFNPSGGGDLKRDMELAMPPERLASRRELLSQVDGLRRAADRSPLYSRLDQYQRQAFEIVLRGVAEAFDLRREDPRTVERYDTSSLFKMEDLTRYYDMRRATNLLGRQMLLARRLVEAGCGFVTVSDCGWDYHANGNSPKNMTGIYPMGGQVDHAVSAFIEDIHERGLSDRVLLIVTGEMGRTPRLNNNGGRDHYGEVTPLLLAGGGLRHGQIIGQTDATASRATTTPYRPEHLMATILHTLFDVGRLRLEQNIPREIVRLAETTQPIDGLF
ncbi:MAG: hypothetical protein RLY70_1716 [Planctomycetota bacterium]|jgi:hypothetical protein